MATLGWHLPTGVPSWAAELHWAEKRRVPALLKTQVEMLAPVLMRYSTSKLASRPAKPEPWWPMTWSTRERWGNVLPNSCMNSARSAWRKYCSKNWQRRSRGAQRLSSSRAQR